MMHHARSNQEAQLRALKTSPLPRVALVTGGTEGIGAVISRKMNDDGHIVAVTYHNEKQATGWQDAMEREGRLFFIYPNDVKSITASQRLVDQIAGDIGSVDILVNAAGRGFGRSREYDSAFNITCAVMDGMQDKGFGRIINISFMHERDRDAAEGAHALTRELSPEVSKNGVTINTISAGEALPVPGVFGKPEDVAVIVSSLASEETGRVTGRNFPATGLVMDGLL